MDYALIGYPLSDRFRQQFEQSTASAPQYLGLPELRRMSPSKLLRTLSGLNANRLFIALESPSSHALLPVFYCFASLARARQIQLIHPDLRCENVSRWQTCRSVAGMLAASFDGWRQVRAARRQVGKLLEQPRILAESSAFDRLLYLKSNLWLGIKAGGSVGHIAGVTNALIDRGYQMDFFAAEPQALVHSEVNYHELPPPQTYGVPYECNLYRYQRMIDRHLEHAAVRHLYQFIYQRMSVSNYSGVVLSRNTKLPLVLEYNGSEVWTSTNWGTKPRYGQLAEQIEDACLRHAHLMVTVSQVLGDELLARGVEPQRVVVYPNCIDPKLFDPKKFPEHETNALRHKWQIPTDAVIAAFVGTFGAWHGVEVLAQAIRQLVSTDTAWLRQHKVHFLIVGDGLRMPQVREILSDPSCQPFFTLTGLVPQAEAPTYIAAADLMLSPHVHNADGSRFFGSPTKLFEYMAMQKPIVAADLEQIGEVLRDSLRTESLPQTPLPANNATAMSVLMQPGDVSGLCRALKFLVERPAWRATLGHNARREVLAKYTWDRHITAILERLSMVTT